MEIYLGRKTALATIKTYKLIPDRGMGIRLAMQQPEAALPNLRSLFSGASRGINDGSIALAAVSCKINLEGGFNTIEPKVSYSSKGFDDIIDAGVNISFLDNVASLMGMYHSPGSVTGGVGVNLFKTAPLQFLYTMQTKGVKTNIDGMYEVGVKV